MAAATLRDTGRAGELIAADMRFDMRHDVFAHMLSGRAVAVARRASGARARLPHELDINSYSELASFSTAPR